MEHGNESNAGREDQPPDSSAMRKQATKARAMGGLGDEVARGNIPPIGNAKLRKRRRERCNREGSLVWSEPKLCAVRLWSSSCEGLGSVDARPSSKSIRRRRRGGGGSGGWVGWWSWGFPLLCNGGERGEEAESSRRGGDALVHRDGNCVRALGLGSVRSKQAGRESGEAKMPLYQGLNRKTTHQSVIFSSREIRGAARGQGSTVASVMEVW